MAKVNVVDKKVSMTLEEIIKFQIITYCYINKITISEADLSCLTLLGLNDEVEISDFCNACCSHDNRDKIPTLSYTKVIFKTPQTVRNCLARMKNYNIISKEGLRQGKIVKLNSDLKVQTNGNILLNYKLYYFDPQKS